MFNKLSLLSVSLALVLSGCQTSGQNKNVISQRFIHKYGYDVPKSEWEAQQYPGQVVTLLRNGSSIVENFEDSLLHGSRTETFPHSQTVQVLEQYHRGSLQKRISYSIRGVPEKEEVFASPYHVHVTYWLPNGAPRCKEEWSGDKLVSGQYFNLLNELEAKLDNGCGERILRDHFGTLQAREYYNDSELVHAELYHLNQIPKESVSFVKGQKTGICKRFTPSGDPLSVEEWHMGKLHGTASYYQNGLCYMEVNYVAGLKNGVERQYIDGKTLCSETHWVDGQKHGPSVVYADGASKTTYYYFNKKVTKKGFDELMDRLAHLSSLNERQAKRSREA